MLSDGFIMASSIPSLGSICISQAVYLVDRGASDPEHLYFTMIRTVNHNLDGMVEDLLFHKQMLSLREL